MTKEGKAQARAAVRKLVAESLANGDPYRWCDKLYRQAGRRTDSIPWADLVPNPGLLDWLEEKSENFAGGKALVVACGLGDDAQALSEKGLDVTSFDISEEAIRWCRERFPDSRVKYLAADLFSPPPEWAGAFDLVVECYTLQTFPRDLHVRAAKAMADMVKPGGTLFAIARGRDAGDPKGEFPWPLLKEELDAFKSAGLREVSFENYMDRENPPVRRFRAEYAKE